MKGLSVYPAITSGPAEALPVTGTALPGDKFALDVAIPAGSITGVTGEFQPTGLQNAGRHTEVALNDVGWVQLPNTSLADRNQINIQNNSGFEIKVNYDPSIPGYTGMRIPDQSERFYQITDGIPIYAKAIPGAGTIAVDVEELS